MKVESLVMEVFAVEVVVVVVVVLKAVIVAVFVAEGAATRGVEAVLEVVVVGEEIEEGIVAMIPELVFALASTGSARDNNALISWVDMLLASVLAFSRPRETTPPESITVLWCESFGAFDSIPTRFSIFSNPVPSFESAAT